MSKLEQAARQAMEALEVSTDWDVGARGKQLQSMKAITALREALAEPKKPEECANGCPPLQVCDYCQRDEQAEQEPVGYWDGKFSKGGASALYEVPQESAFGYHYENYPLYAAPVRTKDLTDDELADACGWKLGDPMYEWVVDIGRWAIAADRENNK